MKQIYGEGALTIAPSNRSFVFAEVHKTTDDGKEKNVLTFNQYSFDTGISTAITKNAYLNTIFTNHSDFLKEEIGDYINVITVFTPKFGMILLSPNGVAKVYDYNCSFKWRGSLKYKGYPPADAVICGESLWCSYPDSNTLIRYNANSMRQEFKISAGAAGELKEPFGLFVSDNHLIITSSSCGLIQSLSLETFELTNIHEIDEPIKKYIKVDTNEIVLTQSGIFRL